MSNGFISRALLIAFVAALAVTPLCMLFFPHTVSKTNTDTLTEHAKSLNELSLQLSGTVENDNLVIPTVTQLPVTKKQKKVTVTPKKIAFASKITPLIISARIQSVDDNNWTAYHNGIMTDAGFGFTYPKTWQLLYKKNNNIYTYFFSPQHSLQNGQIMTIHVFTPVSSIKNFIANNYPELQNAPAYEKFGSIGNKPLYKLTTKNDLPNYSHNASIGVVLGKLHAYSISFDDTGTREIIDQIEDIVWPQFKFE